MKVLMLIHGRYLVREEVVAGNSVRAYYLAHALVHHGIQVIHVYPADLGAPSRGAETPAPGITLRVYRDQKALADLLAEERPDVLLVGYWELLERLPAELPMPVVLDVVAPRLVEAMYQEDRDLGDEVQRMLNVYRKADRFLVGNQRQRHLLLPLLILAGFDCRKDIPIDVIPISTQPGEPLPGDPLKQSWRFVSGGVSWPWRRTQDYFDALVKGLQERPDTDAKLILFSGKYIYAADEETPAPGGQAPCAWPEAIVQQEPLQPYGEMERFLVQHGDIGIELADRNVEREYSQSFRAMEFLRSGLPIICSGYLELAEHVRRFDAGWLVNAPHELPELVERITSSPAEWRRKSENAIRLVSEDFHYLKTIEPLVAFLRDPQRPARRGKLLGDRAQPDPVTPEPTLAPSPPAALPPVQSAKPPWRARAKSFGVAVLRKLLALRGKPTARTIIMVSRADIFPANHGAAVKIDRTAWGLSRQASTVFLVTDDRESFHVYENGVRRERYYPRWLSRLAPTRERVRETLLRRDFPAHDAFLYYPLSDWSYIVRALYLGMKHGASVFIAEFPAYARPCLWARELLGGTALLVEHNVEYQRLREQTPDLPQDVYESLRNVEILLCNRVDKVITVSQRDKDRLAGDGADDRKIHVVPHGVDLEQFDHVPPLDVRKRFHIPAERPLLVYHGIYLYPPNLEAMRVMAGEILPRLHAQGTWPKVLAIGANPPAKPVHEDIIFTGPVENIAPYLLAADIAVVPLQKGGGTRMKVLDYFAARLPVVSTTKGIEGIPVENGVQAVIEDDHDRFARAVTDLINDLSRARELGACGRAFVEKLDWQTITGQYLQLIDAAC